MRKGKLFVLSGPSGVGKGSICRELFKKIDDVELSISMTTRDAREGEVHGVHYYFVSREEFEANIEAGGFLEYAQTFENYYGTPKAPVIEHLESGRDVLLEIDVKGGMQVKKAYPEAVLIFVLPPTLETLRERLHKRGSESEEKVNQRLSIAMEEMGYLPEYEYFVINDDLMEAVGVVEEIIDAEHHAVGRDVDEILERYKED